MGIVDGLLGAGLGVGASIFGESQGIGKNKFNAQNFGDSSQYNPNQFNYGGTPGGADAAANQYYNNGQGAEARQAYQTNYGQAGLYQGMGDAARAGQAQAAGLMMQRATGQTPSIAGMQAAHDMNAANAAIASSAAGARGPAALALAQQGAGQNVANAYSNISGQAQINAANERMQAENSAYGAYGGLRQGDLGQQQQLANQSQFQAGLDMNQRQLNDSYSLGNSQLANSVRQSQLQAGQYEQGLLSGSQSQANAINSGIAGNNAAVDKNYLDSAVAAANGGLKSAMSTDPGAAPVPGKAAGGPVLGGNPYLMGEQGPELVVPGLTGASSGGSDPGGNPTGDYSIRGGGMDVMGSLAKMSAAGTNYMSNPGGGMMARANGGPVSSGQPYLVGERGPEMVVPQQNAVVIPAQQTAGLLAAQKRQEMNAQADAILGLMGKRSGR